MIELNSVTKRFGDFAALDELTFTVPKGSVCGLIGPNGAGKTTAIRTVTGMLRPDSGSVLLDGAPVWENAPAKARMTCIPDSPWAFAGASTREMKEFYRRMYPGFDNERYEKLRGVFSLDDRTPVRRLSRGMKKQSAFWLALAARPEVLLLDEPVDGLDPVMRRKIWQLIVAEVEEREMTVLISSHNLRELEDVCDRVVILRQGRCLLEKTVEDLQESVCKFLVALPEGETLPEDLEILSESRTGKLTTLILRGREEELRQKLQTLGPAFLDVQPLTLEEIFIYEVGGGANAVRDILD